jgi:UDP-N-acetylglucosamine 4-epimerase
MRILITGGAGFIGSNVVEKLLQDQRISLVRVLDNLATGSMQNIQIFSQHPKFEFRQADIRNYAECVSACDLIDCISHQAALGSVPRSIADPLTTNEVNITGTLNIFTAAKETHYLCGKFFYIRRSPGITQSRRQNW